jgi:hypothetical protein
MLEKTTISSEQLAEWVKKVPALKQVLILDTCAAGAAAAKLTERGEVSGDQIRAIDRLKDRVGFHVLMGCAADRVSYETSRFGQGLLTYALLQGMKGAALRDNDYVDVEKLFQYASDEVPKLAQNIGGIQQPRVVAPGGTRFDVGKLSEQEKAVIPLSQIRPLILRPHLLNANDFTDSLNLSTLLMRRLNDITAALPRGASPSLAYVDSDEFPGAIKPTGGYAVDGNKVVVHLVLSEDGKIRKLEPVNGSTASPADIDRLVENLAQVLELALQKQQ